jgi:flagellin
LTGSKAIVLKLSTYTNQADVVTDMNAQLTSAGLAGIVATGAAASKFTFTSATLGAFTIAASGGSASLATLGLNASATAGGTAASSGNAWSTTVANGAYEMAGTSSGSSVVSNFKYVALADHENQSISITAADSTGASHVITVNLDHDSTASPTAIDTGSTIDKAIGEINSKLQKSNDATLQQITAVKVNENGVDKINLVSTLNNFSVAIGSGTAGDGITDASGNQGKTTQALQIGSGGSADISTVAGAQAAVTAISKAVSALGTAQAAIGRGQNALNYGISLANSQITNFSAAESQIRDANVAQQAANLSKAQTLSQAAIAAMAQANSAPQGVLSLLRG